jgi:hypothetical protein
MSRYGGPSRNQVLVARRTVDNGQQAVMGDILREQRKGRGPIHRIVEAERLLEVGPCAPPVRIYRPGPKGALVLAEVVSAMDFRARSQRRTDAKSSWRDTMRAMLPVGPKRPRGRPRKVQPMEGADA